MTALLLPDSVYAEMIAHAERGLPDGVSGWLLGSSERIERAITSATDVDMSAIIGMYRSHPQGMPTPSRDEIVAIESNPDRLLVIVSLARSSPRVAAWRWYEGRIQPIELLFNETDAAPDVWTDHQKTAMIVGTLISVIVLIILSVNLLPPPP